MRADANAEENANATTRRASPRRRWCARLTAPTSTHTIASGIVTRPGRRNPRLPVVSSTWSRRRSRGGGAGTRRTPTGARRARTSSPRASPRARRRGEPRQARLRAAGPVRAQIPPTSGCPQARRCPRRGASRPAPSRRGRRPVPGSSPRGRGRRASATPTVYFPASPSSEESSPPRPRAPAAPAPASPATPGSLSSEVSEDASPGALDRVADAFVLDDAKSPGPMGPVLREPKTNARAVSKTNSTVYTLSPTSPLVGTRRGDSSDSLSASPSSASEASDGPLTLSGVSRKRSSPPGSRANKHAAAAARGRARRLRHRRARGG